MDKLRSGSVGFSKLIANVFWPSTIIYGRESLMELSSVVSSIQ